MKIKLISLLSLLCIAAKPAYIDVDGYDKTSITYVGGSPMIEPSQKITDKAEFICQHSAEDYAEKHARRGYLFYQRHDSPKLLGITQLVNGRRFKSIFHYRCDGVYMLIQS